MNIKYAVGHGITKAKKASPRLNLIKYWIVQYRKFDVSQKNTDYFYRVKLWRGRVILKL